MHEYIARLIRCGMPRTVALAVCRYYWHRRDELEQYVKAVEQENGGMEVLE